MVTPFLLPTTIDQPTVMAVSFTEPINGGFVVVDQDGNEVASGVVSSATDHLLLLVRRGVELTLQTPGGTASISSVDFPKPQERTTSITIVDQGSQTTHTVPERSAVSIFSASADDDITASGLISSSASSASVTSGAVFVGEGFYGAETSDGRPLRWLGESGDILVVRPPNDDGIELVVSCSSGPTLGPGASLVLRSADDTSLGRRTIGSESELRYYVPPSWLGEPINRFALEVSNPAPIPFREDPRNLAVRCDSIQVREVDDRIIEEQGVIDQVGFVPGWEAEPDGDGLVRWLYEYGEIVVTFSGVESNMALLTTVRPGPCLDPVNNRLQLLRPDGSKISEVRITSPDMVSLDVTDDDIAVGETRLTLRLVNPSPRRYALDDRQLNLQILGLDLVPAGAAHAAAAHYRNRFNADVRTEGAVAAAVKFGSGWQPPETAGLGGDAFRWMGETAELHWTPSSTEALRLHLRSGPELHGALELHDLDSGLVLTEVDLSLGQATATINSPATGGALRLGLTCPVAIDPEGADKRGDPRVLAARLIRIDTETAEPCAQPVAASEGSRPAIKFDSISRRLRVPRKNGSTR